MDSTVYEELRRKLWGFEAPIGMKLAHQPILLSLTEMELVLNLDFYRTFGKAPVQVANTQLTKLYVK